MKILGLSFFYHDSAVCLLVDGKPVAMAEEERFSRVKHDNGFPKQAINFVLESSGIKASQLDWIVYYEKPFLKFERIIKTLFATWPKAPLAFSQSIKNLFINHLWVRQIISSQLNVDSEKILFSKHHLSHAASAFFCSPFNEAAILTIDGVGEWCTASLGAGNNNDIKIFKELHFPHSIGLLYSTFTSFLGFKINEGEYKVMGLAPYGKPEYVDEIKKIIGVYNDGSFALKMKYFLFHRSIKKSFSKKFIKLFNDIEYKESKKQFYADIAASIQKVAEELIINLAKELYRLTKIDRLCLAGGVALNSVANREIVENTSFKEIYIQPAAGDSGAALGAALAVNAIALNQPRNYVLNTAGFGKKYSNEEIKKALIKNSIEYSYFEDDQALANQVAELIKQGKVVGWFNGRFEWGPRALGNRCILADARKAEMKDIINAKIKFREPFRPFAPSVLAEHAEKFFDFSDVLNQWPARFMLYVVPVKEEQKKVVPAIVHVDGTSRPQLVFKEQSPKYWQLINSYYKLTNIPLILNTSFNLKGEPIVNTPQQAIDTFRKSGLDVLVLENYLIV